MGLGRALLCIFLPPLAVLDKGCGAILITTIFWLLGWIPGVVAAMIFCTRDPN
ncbi:MAG TPA: YqaE/Pmp3 family membrane protein [Candidatus Brocadiia bacterium]|nr:YqaE/Pmp3 family membrane protein [Candidatus Brocadiia bacterium]